MFSLLLSVYLCHTLKPPIRLLCLVCTLSTHSFSLPAFNGCKEPEIHWRSHSNIFHFWLRLKFLLFAGVGLKVQQFQMRLGGYYFSPSAGASFSPTDHRDVLPCAQSACDVGLVKYVRHSRDIFSLSYVYPQVLRVICSTQSSPLAVIQSSTSCPDVSLQQRDRVKRNRLTTSVSAWHTRFYLI